MDFNNDNDINNEKPLQNEEEQQKPVAETAQSSPEPDKGNEQEKEKESGGGIGAKLLAPIKNKKFRYGAYSSVISIVMIAVLVAVNLVVGQFDYSFDLTSDQRYSISDKTKSVLESLEEDITIYTLYRTGTETESEEIMMYSEILDQYESGSEHIKIVNKDPYVNLTFVEQYQSAGTPISDNSIIVESGNRYKVVDASELLTTSYAYDANYNIVTQTNLEIESKTTNAIVYVTQTNTPVVYTLTGHNEAELNTSLQSAIKDANYDLGSVNLLSGDIPEDCSVLVITTPEVDLNEDEAAKLLAYLQGGGRALFLIDKAVVAMPNLESVLNTYGVILGDYYIFEGDADYTYMYPYYFIPQMNSHSINTSIIESGYPMLMAFAQGIDTLDTYKSTLTIESLLSTTNDAYGKTADSIESANKSTGDLDGPFDVAVAITDNFYIGGDSTVSKLVVAGTSSILDSQLDSMVYGTNSEFVINALGWLTDKSDADTVYVASKSLTSRGADTVSITSGTAVRVMVFSLGVYPGAILIIGIVVWLRRRNR